MTAAQPPAAPMLAVPFDPSERPDMVLTQVLYHSFDEIWNKGNLDSIARVMRPDTLIFGAVSGQEQPNSDYSEVVTALRNLLGPIRIRFTHAMECAGWVSARLLIRTSNPAGGAPFQFSGQIMARIEDGAIAEMHSDIDYMRMFEKLGQLPPDCIALCMTGERLK